MSTARICPVCRRPVEKTMRDNIAGHLDSTRIRACDGSFQPWRIAYTDTTPPPENAA